MAWIAGGDFAMGSDDFYPEERPVHQVTVDGFWMDEHPVTTGFTCGAAIRSLRYGSHPSRVSRAGSAAATIQMPSWVLAMAGSFARGTR